MISSKDLFLEIREEQSQERDLIPNEYKSLYNHIKQDENSGSSYQGIQRS